MKKAKQKKYTPTDGPNNVSGIVWAVKMVWGIVCDGGDVATKIGAFRGPIEKK
jgi:hypothetical protein